MATHWMAHWCGIAHDHAEIDGATRDAATTNKTGSTTDMPQQPIDMPFILQQSTVLPQQSTDMPLIFR
jgi:hypothetical protein